VVNQANPARSLLMDQVGQIFDGNLQDWLAVGGGAGRIHVYTIKSPSDVRVGFAALAKIGDQDSSNAHPQPDMAGVVASVAADQNGIGVVDLPHIGPLHALALESPPHGPLAPTNALALLLADYPLTYPLYFYTPGAGDDGIPEHFVAFALSPEGQKVVTQLGLVSPFMAPPTMPLEDGASDRLRNFVGAAQRLVLAFNFQGESSALDEAGQRDIDRLASLLQMHHVRGDRLLVAGFGDNRVRPRQNQQATRARAEAVAALLAQHGLRPARVGGFGADMPVADNDTDDGAALNRRVEIYVLP
jgi:phosphate transport system substrate-binding protein